MAGQQLVPGPQGLPIPGHGVAAVPHTPGEEGELTGTTLHRWIVSHAHTSAVPASGTAHRLQTHVGRLLLPQVPTPQAPLTRGFFHLGLSLSGPSGETPLTSPFPAVLPACGGRVAPQAGLWDSPSWPLSACRTPRLVPLLEVTAERRPNFLSVLPPPGPWFPKHPISPSGPSEPCTHTRGSSLLLLPYHGNLCIRYHHGTIRCLR